MKPAIRNVLLVAALCGDDYSRRVAIAADDTLKIAIGQRGGWEQCVSELGQNNGFFKKHGLVLDVLYTQGSAETLQSVISTSVDIGSGLAPTRCSAPSQGRAGARSAARSPAPTSSSITWRPIRPSAHEGRRRQDDRDLDQRLGLQHVRAGSRQALRRPLKPQPTGAYRRR